MSAENLKISKDAVYATGATAHSTTFSSIKKATAKAMALFN